jgi:hypothetical protein
MRSAAGVFATAAGWLPVPEQPDPEGSSWSRCPDRSRGRDGETRTYDASPPDVRSGFVTVRLSAYVQLTPHTEACGGDERSRLEDAGGQDGDHERRV